MKDTRQRDDQIEVKAIVKGRVQGVGFRYTARNHAVRLGLVGCVRNLPNGDVEVYALGKRFSVDALMKILKDDPGAGQVSAIYVEEIFPPNSYDSFMIL